MYSKTWLDMIKECITTITGLPCRGVSRTQLKKYIGERYNIQIGPDQVAQLSEAIALGRRKGIFIFPNGLHGRVDLAPKHRSTGASKKTKALPLSELKFSKQRGAFDLSNADGFVSLLDTIRRHLLRSKSTRAVYVAMAKEFYSNTTNDLRGICGEPTDDDFLAYVRSNWPTFKSCLELGAEEGTLIWGWVYKQEAQKMNVINILSNLVEAAEKAPVVMSRRLPTELYHLIITVVVFHELAHAFIKFFFYDNDTPRGVGIDERQGGGEAGWWVEEKIMGGYLHVEWTDKTRFGDMLSIDNLFLVKDKKCLEIDEDVAKTMLSSLRQTKFIQPAEEKMTKHISPHGAVRARVTEPSKKPHVPVGSCRGLGITFGSFVGQDKKNSNLDRLLLRKF